MRKVRISKKEGAIGIGTLIIFIALILVAAIAAAVIIGTAEDLEERAQQASQDAERLVEATPQIMIAEGSVTTAQVINEIYLYIDLYGSTGVDMRNVVLHILVSPNGGNPISVDLRYNTASPTGTGATFFGTSEVIDTNNQYDPIGTPARYILGEAARLKLTINFPISSIPTLAPDSMIQIWMHTTTSGHETYDLFETPTSYPANGGIVSLED